MQPWPNRWVDPDTVRADLINYTWKGGGMPSRLATLVAHNFSTVTGASSWDRYTVGNIGGTGAVSYFDLVTPAGAANGRILFVMTGNSGDWAPGGYPAAFRMTQSALAAGYHLCGLAIPGRGPNPDPEAITIGGVATSITAGGVLLGDGTNSNYQPYDLPTSTTTSLGRMMEPIIVATNQIKAIFPDLTVCMFGHSGGGWSCEMASAIDTRITYSCSLMGGFPWGLNDWAWIDDGSQYGVPAGGGYIQWHLNPYMIHGGMHMDRHRLRGQYNRRAVLGMSDGDIYYRTTLYHPQMTSFVEQCNDRINDFGSGEFDILYDTVADDHTITQYAVDLILADIDDYLARRVP